MVPTDYAKTNDVALFVKDFQSLRAVNSWQPGDNTDFTKSANVTIAIDEVAAFDEVFVRLWIVKPADDGPYGGDRCGDPLDRGGAALVGSHKMCVVFDDGIWYLCSAWYWCVAL